MQSRDKELLKKAMESLKKSNKKQAELIKEKEKQIKELNKKIISISYELRVLKNKYKDLYYNLFEKKN